MIDRISNWVLNKISSKDQTKEDKEVLLFGITRIVEDIPKTIGIILIGFLLNILKEMAIVTIIIATYKTFVGGVHAKTNWGCFVSSVIFYLVIIYASKYLMFEGTVGIIVYLLIYIFSVYSILVYVPADVPEIPKVNLKLRKTLKIKAFICLNIIYLLTFILFDSVEIKNILLYSVFVIDIMTTRTIYKIFKNEYGYITYVPDELI